MPTTLTLELPDYLAARLASLPPEEVHAFAVAALDDATADFDAELDETTRDALREADDDDVAAGRFYPVEEMDVRVEAFLRERREQREQERAAAATP